MKLILGLYNIQQHKRIRFPLVRSKDLKSEASLSRHFVLPAIAYCNNTLSLLHLRYGTNMFQTKLFQWQ